MARKTKISSWSNAVTAMTTRLDWGEFDAGENAEYIPRGGGCSFSDAAFLTDGFTVGAAALNHIALDRDHSICRCGAGVTLGGLHLFLASQGMNFPVYGGTQWATVGGAIASDIHGKNQHVAGTFGNHVAAISITTPRSGRITCSREKNPDLFAATIGGMGLTGHIHEAQLKLAPGAAGAVRQTRKTLSSYAEMFRQFETTHDFQFACVFNHGTPMHGFHFCADFIDGPSPAPPVSLNLPWLPRIPIVNDRIIRIADRVSRLSPKNSCRVGSAFSFNFSGIHQILRQMNRLMVGTIEYHYNLPDRQFRKSLTLLDSLAKRHDVILTHLVFKKLGDIVPEGIISFVREGFGLNFQIANNVKSRLFLHQLSDALNHMGARYYLAKDSCLSAEQYHRATAGLLEWQRIVRQWDPGNQIKSDLAARLNLKPW